MFRLRSKKVLVNGELLPRVVTIEEGKITALSKWDSPFDQDFGDLAILPGCIDLHVHINEPGRTEWEGYESGTKAAIAGGTTTIVDMPLNCIPSTIDVPSLEIKRKVAKEKAFSNIGFWGGAVPGNDEDIPLLHHAGVRGFKCFMVPSGVDEFDFVTTQDLENAAKAIAPTGATLLAHAEDPDVIEKSSHIWTGENGFSYEAYLLSRPEDAEEKAVQTLVRISKKYDLPVHVVHVASAKALDVIRKAKKEGVKITGETCVHYLVFSSDDIEDANTVFKCAPPIRQASVREALWEGLTDGTLDFITTDHSPSLPSLKGIEEGSPSFGRFDKAWGGIASIQLLLSAVWTEAEKRGHSLEKVSYWLSESPAKWNSFKKKGKIEKGFDADLVIFDPEEEYEIDAKELFHRHKITPYDGRKCKGRVVQTFINGKLAYNQNAENMVLGPYGKLV